MFVACRIHELLTLCHELSTVADITGFNCRIGSRIASLESGTLRLPASKASLPFMMVTSSARWPSPRVQSVTWPVKTLGHCILSLDCDHHVCMTWPIIPNGYCHELK